MIQGQAKETWMGQAPCSLKPATTEEEELTLSSGLGRRLPWEQVSPGTAAPQRVRVVVLSPPGGAGSAEGWGC